MSSEEEFDYMSDNFLAECVQTDIRPGLIHNRTKQREHEILKHKKVTDEQNKERFKPYKVVEQERREDGLNSAISSDNKGFALMQKMGYKPGTGIGKSGAGRVEPISIELKSGRHGLGQKTALKEIAARKAAIRTRNAQLREQLTNTDDYRARMTKKAAERQTEADLRKSQRICEQLDGNKEYKEPAEKWFWPEKIVEKEDESDEEEEEGDDDTEEDEIEFEPPEKLEMLTLYLRRTHFYCVWCGAQYEDDKDLADNCPGATREDH